MNPSEEDKLLALRLRAPSASLDDRVARLLAVPRRARRSWLVRPIALWQGAVACAACAAVAFLSALYLQGTAPTAQQINLQRVVEVREMPFEVFDWTRYPASAAPASVLKSRRNTTSGSSNSI